MTRVTVYAAALLVFIAATSMTISSILLPNWTTYSSPSSTGAEISRSLGLHSSCSSTALTLISDYSHPSCTSFPVYEDCQGTDRHFCSMWRSVGWLLNLGAVLELATIIGFLVIMIGGKQSRESGWRILSFSLVMVAVVQCAGMSIVAYLYDNDSERFFSGWTLDTSFYLCTISWSITILTAAGITLSALILPSEGGYELIPSERIR